MPDKQIAQSFLSTAKKLAPRDAKRQSQGNLRRSISSSYFAMFHALARVAADSLVGSRRKNTSKHAWIEVYRGLEHGTCRTRCVGASKPANENDAGAEFPDEIRNFAANFVQIQDARKRADYDPIYRPTLEEARVFLTTAELSIKTLNSASKKDKTAFVTWVLIKSAGANHARQLQKGGAERSLINQ